MKLKQNQILGHGLYSIREAAAYARISPAKMARWLHGNTRGNAVLESQYEDRKQVSFLDLVQTLAVREILQQKKVSLQKLRDAVEYTKVAFGINYPFARMHQTYLFDQEIVIRLPGHHLSDSQFVTVSGKHKGQLHFTFVEMYLENLSYDETGLAKHYVIYRHPVMQGYEQVMIPVTMDPKFRFGAPRLPSGYSVHALWDAIIAEGGIDEATQAYQVPRPEVVTAYHFYTNFFPLVA